MTHDRLAITELSALEILDSRGNPTLQVTLTDGSGATHVAGVPSGASTGTREAAGADPLWMSLRPTDVEPRLPVPHFNVLNGGVHAPNDLDFQEFMIAPVGAPTFPEAVRAGAAVYGKLRALLHGRGEATGLGDEGGFAPNVAVPEDVLRLIVQAIEDAGYPTGASGVAIALDPAASEFYRDGSYHVAGESLSSDDMIARYEQIASDFPVWSLEDGLAEGDWDGWERLTARLGERLQLVGDDIFVTNPAIITEAVERGVGNSSLIKLNQIGTVTETLEAQRISREAGYTQMISHRSGETPDSFIADLTVATGTGQLKSGAPARGERVAKYNRLLDIAAAAPELSYGLTQQARIR